MHTSKIARLVTTYILIIILVACNLPGSGGVVGSGACTNPLYPVAAGTIWTYDSRGGTIVGDYTFTASISDARPDGFTVSLQYSTGVTAAEEWSCQAGALINLTADTGGTASSLSTNNGVTSRTQTTGNSGVTLPALINPGDSWSQTLNIHGTVNYPDGRTGTGDGSLLSNFRAIGLETISVPAGTFEAMHIEVQTTYNLVMTVQGTTVPMTVNNSLSMWYAPSVGMVKAIKTNEIIGTENIELTGYTIP